MARILVIDDDKGICEFLEIFLKREGQEIKAIQSPSKALSLVENWKPEIILLDLRLPEMDGLSLLSEIKKIEPAIIVILITAFASIESAIEAMRRGAFDYITKPFKIDEIRLVLTRAMETYTLRKENVSLKQTLEQITSTSIIGESKAFQDVIELLHKIAGTDSTILIYGESGTGKELIAKEIHRLSMRKDNPFIAINCGALPETLLESELFGYTKGSFTGARRIGLAYSRLVIKEHYFLDEISNATPKIQVGLLRVLEEREITPVGSTKAIPVDVRLLTATNQNLEQLVKEGKFREDLYYRINVIPVYLPSLRERREDIPLLARYFLRKYCAKHKIEAKKLHPETIRLLINYNWPGNIRELENVIERAIILEKYEIISPNNLPDKVKEASLSTPTLTEKEESSVFDKSSIADLTTRQHEILKYLKENHRINSQKCVELFQVTQRTGRNDLQTLINKKLIVRQGTGKKNTYYTLA